MGAEEGGGRFSRSTVGTEEGGGVGRFSGRLWREGGNFLGLIAPVSHLHR